MGTQLEYAKMGTITQEMAIVAKDEFITPDEIRNMVACGDAVIPKNILHNNVKPIGIGEKLKTKVNANIGTSKEHPEIENELEKLKAAIEAGTDAVMDLSTGGDLSEIRRKIIQLSPCIVGTVPIYEQMVKGGPFSIDNFLKLLEEQAQQGVDFFTIHSGIRKEHIPYVEKRVMGVVSRGGAYLIHYMAKNNEENPLYTHFGRILEICAKYDVTLSLGDGLRPGCINDATDYAQISELEILGRLAQRSRDAGVQVMIEGPGHVPLNQIQENLDLKRKYAGNTPFYVLGPLVTDIAPGYDHITGAIGGALAAYFGASFLCYVTPREHLGLPNAQDVKDGVVASRIAAHAADIALGKPNAVKADLELSKARVNFDWDTQFKYAIDPQKAKERKDICSNTDLKVCSMCGDYCSMKVSRGL